MLDLSGARKIFHVGLENFLCWCFLVAEKSDADFVGLKPDPRSPTPDPTDPKHSTCEPPDPTPPRSSTPSPRTRTPEPQTSDTQPPSPPPPTVHPLSLSLSLLPSLAFVSPFPSIKVQTQIQNKYCMGLHGMMLDSTERVRHQCPPFSSFVLCAIVLAARCLK